MPLTATRDHFMSRQLSREPVQVRHAREQARKALFKWSLGEHAELVKWSLGEHAELGELIVSELVTNALRHGEGKIQSACLMPTATCEWQSTTAGRDGRSNTSQL